MVMGALVHNPNVWILDEPLIGLDPQSSILIIGNVLLYWLSKNKISHNIINQESL